MCTLLVTLPLLLAAAVPALADEPANADRVQISRRSDGKPVYVVPPVIVRGKVQRPEAVFVLPRPKISYEWPELKRDLLPSIVSDARR
jgi:hypothetical protein